MSIQLGLKLLGMAITIYLVRILDKSDYAFFTIAISVLHTIVLLSDSGIGSGMMAIGGRHWKDKFRMGQLVSSAMTMRKQQFYPAVLFAIPMMCWLLWKNEAPTITIILLSAIVIVGAAFELRTVVFTAVLKLNDQFDKVQQIDIINTIIRVALVFSISLFFMNAVLAVLVSSLAYIVNYFVSKNWSSIFSINSASYLKEDRKEIGSIVKHQLPNAIYFSITGQISVYLISIFGNTAQVAEVGVLTRLAFVFSILTMTLSTVVLPRFSKFKDPRKINQLFLYLVGGFSILSILLLIFANSFPQAFLFIFGEKYAHLENELTWLIGGTMITVISGVIYKINSGRGWIVKWWIFIPVGIITQLIGVLLLNLSSVTGVLQFNILLNVPTLLIFIGLFYYKIGVMKKESKSIKYSTNVSSGIEL